MTDLLHIIPLLIFNCLWCVGFNAVTYFEYTIKPNGGFSISHKVTGTPENESKMLFWFVRYHSVKIFGEYWSKPICLCLPCMGSLHSLWFWAFNPLSWHNAMIYILYAVTLAGLNKLVLAKFDL